jgi:hypothetical protein
MNLLSPKPVWIYLNESSLTWACLNLSEWIFSHLSLSEWVFSHLSLSESIWMNLLSPEPVWIYLNDLLSPEPVWIFLNGSFLTWAYLNLSEWVFSHLSLSVYLNESSLTWACLNQSEWVFSLPGFLPALCLALPAVSWACPSPRSVCEKKNNSWFIFEKRKRKINLLP